MESEKKEEPAVNHAVKLEISTWELVATIDAIRCYVAKGNPREGDIARFLEYVTYLLTECSKQQPKLYASLAKTIVENYGDQISIPGNNGGAN